MKKKNNSKMLKSLKISLFLVSFIITNISVLIFALVEYTIYDRMGRPGSFAFIDAVGMIIPMGLVLGLVSWVTIRTSYRYISTLMNGIQKVADGDFNVSLNEEKGGLFKEVYRNFNKMVYELNNTQTLREDFINHFSHEFKTPIMSINGFASLLLKQDLNKDDEIRYLGIISAESKRLSELSSNSLLLTKLESKVIHPTTSAIHLDEQIRECVILLSPLWMDKKIDLTADLSPTIVEVNKDLMKHVWINLLSNAIKYTPKYGEITINLKTEKMSCSITIQDSGIGMDQQDQASMFNKFYKGNNNYSSSGLGLGLSIVKRILDLSSGMIKAESTPGKGSCFTVLLPIKKTQS